jgi:hypothetical protein
MRFGRVKPPLGEGKVSGEKRRLMGVTLLWIFDGQKQRSRRAKKACFVAQTPAKKSP